MLPESSTLRNLPSVADAEPEVNSMAVLLAVYVALFIVAKNLPVEFSNCTNLRILFIKECRNMTIIPPVLGNMPNLTRLGLKSNGIRIVHGKSLPSNIEHLILTDNNITHIDHDASIRLGKSCRKLMLSHNKLSTFGNDTDCSMLQNMELLRLSNNNLTALIN